MNDDADLFAGRVSAMNFLGGQSMRSVLYLIPSCILAMGAMYTPPASRQQRGNVEGTRRTGSRRYEGEYSPLYNIFRQVCT